MNIFEEKNEEDLINTENETFSEENVETENQSTEPPSFDLNNLASDERVDYSSSVNLDKLQEIIQSFDSENENNDGNETTAQLTNFDFINKNTFMEDSQEEYLKSNETNFEEDLQKKKPKKFVVQIQPKNIEYFNKLPVDTRNQIINQALVKKQVEAYENKIGKVLIHIFIFLFTILIFVPICFWVAKKSIQSSLDSSKQVQHSFETLYKLRGGVKHKNLKNLKNVNF